MTRLSASRAPTAIALVAATFSVLALVAFPGLSIGDPTTSQGESPSDVFTTTEPEICADVDVVGVGAMPTAVTLERDSHLIVYFTSEWSGLRPGSELLLTFDIFDDTGGFVENTPFEWGLDGELKTHHSGTVMWTFDDVAAGTYTVSVGARVDPAPLGPGGSDRASAVLENCALTAFVSPVALA